MTKLKQFSGKLRQSPQSWLNQNLVVGTFSQNGFEVTLSSKTNVIRILKWHFSVFANFLVTKLKTLSGRGKQHIQDYLNQILVIRTFL